MNKRSMFKRRSGGSIFRDRKVVGYRKVLVLIKKNKYRPIIDSKYDFENLMKGKFSIAK
jgi:hypothetical protein